jgi:hypothetical protein
MQIRAGYDISYYCAAPTPMLLVLSVRPERLADLITPQTMTIDPLVQVDEYRQYLPPPAGAPGPDFV